MSKHKTLFNTVLAISKNYGIGYQGRLPWKLKGDMQFFKEITNTYKLMTGINKKNVVIMGRNTWESIPQQFKPLKNRINIVITSTPKKVLNDFQAHDDLYVASSLDNSLDLIEADLQNKYGSIFVIGGAKLYEESFHHPCSNELFLTRVWQDIKCDRFIDKSFLEKFEHLETSKTLSENKLTYDFSRYINKSQVNGAFNKANYVRALPTQHEEYQYSNLIEEIINHGFAKNDRTGVGTHSLFGKMMRFDLKDSFPLLTTKEVFWRGVVEELLWFIRGDTDSKKLSEKKVKIWDANGSREFLDKLGFKEREEGDLGPVYGFQWRHFGAKYVDCKTDYSNQGVDQLKWIINQIKTNPDSRRLLMSAWNPVDLSLMALPPCHVLTHFYIADNKLSCLLYQRSADIGLGVPFNIASYALLTCMIAHVCGLERGEFVHTIGDAHVYNNHIESLKKQITRVPYPFPYLEIKRNIKDIEDFKIEDLNLIGYYPHGKIKMQMAV